MTPEEKQQHKQQQNKEFYLNKFNEEASQELITLYSEDLIIFNIFDKQKPEGFEEIELIPESELKYYQLRGFGQSFNKAGEWVPFYGIHDDYLEEYKKFTQSLKSLELDKIHSKSYYSDEETLYTFYLKLINSQVILQQLFQQYSNEAPQFRKDLLKAENKITKILKTFKANKLFEKIYLRFQMENF